MEDNGPVEVTSSNPHLNELFLSSCDEESVRLTELSRMYVLSLLAPRRLPPSRTAKALALTYLEASHAGGRLRQELLQQTGDAALVQAGCWWLSLSRSPVDVDYFVQLGSSAYADLPDRIFAELSRKFDGVVNALIAMTARQWAKESQQNLLRIYEVYQKTRNRRLAHILRGLGLDLPGSTAHRSLH